ncbi:MAG: class I SAM-dependent methyltransferase [bacterium]
MTLSQNNNRNALSALSKLKSAILEIWPEHKSYIEHSFSPRNEQVLNFSEQLAQIVCRLGEAKPGGLSALARDYRYLCEKIVFPEEMYFRRHGRYRLDKFDDALTEVYMNKPLMTKYMNGLLVSSVLWINHCNTMRHYQSQFLPTLPQKADILEIGPGHGLLLYLSDKIKSIGTVTAWDISEASLQAAAQTLDLLGAERRVALEQKNIFDTTIMTSEYAAKFDAVILSEVLEHLETPQRALDVLYHLVKPGGRVWINVPANSPAPDHIFLIDSIAEAEKLVKAAGFNIVESCSFPSSGASLEKAQKLKLAVSCVIIGEK